ncbi:MAG: DUF5058 family protein [Clostridioides sp.]|jgi:hypothetical protein|nr:DUF5058 family protein [Clostridioides sp.]
MTFWDVADSRLLFGLVAIGLLFVMGLAGLLALKAYKHSADIGIEKETVKKVVTSAITTSIVPSFSIVIGLMSLATVLGTAWSWFRLSVVGAVSYELMAADMAAQSMGFANLGIVRDQPGNIMIAVMLVMSVGICAGIIINIFASKKITTTMADYSQKKGGWGALFSNCFMMTMIVVLLFVQIVSGIVSCLTIATSLFVAIVLGFIAKKANAPWLGEFSLALTLILSMASSVLWTGLFS